MDEAQDIIIVNKEGVLTNLTALSPTRCIPAINLRPTAADFDQQRLSDKSHGFQSTEMQNVVYMARKILLF